MKKSVSRESIPSFREVFTFKQGHHDQTSYTADIRLYFREGQGWKADVYFSNGMLYGRPSAHEDYRTREGMQHISVSVPSNGISKARRKVGSVLKQIADYEDFVEFWKRTHGVRSDDIY